MKYIDISDINEILKAEYHHRKNKYNFSIND